jgi:hypothetical protein
VNRADKYMKTYSTSIATKEIQIKSIIRFYLTPVRMAIIKKTVTNAGEDTGKKEPSYTFGGNVN